MTEKKYALYDLRVNYNGPVNIEDFFAEVDKWIESNDYRRENKKHLERVTKEGKQIEWVIEAHRALSDIVTSVLKLRVLFKNVKEIVVKKHGKRLRTNHVDVLISVDAIIESHFSETWWHGKVVFQVIRTLLDKFVYQFWTFKYDGIVQADGHSLFKQLRAFLSLQKYKYQEHSTTQKLYK